MAEGSRPIYDLPVVSNEYDVLQFPVDQNNVAKRVYATDLADYFKNTVILENTIQNMDLSVSLTASEIYDFVKDGQIVLFDSGFLESNSTVSCLFPIYRVEKNGNDYTAFVYVQNELDDEITEYAIDIYGNVTVTDTYDFSNPNRDTTYDGSNRLILDYTPTENTQAVNKAYVDSVIGSGGGSSGDEVLYTAQSKTNGEKLQACRNIGMLSPFVSFLYASSHLQSVDGVLTGNQIVSKYGLSSVQNMSGMFAIDINNYKAYYLDSFDYDHGTVVFRRKEGDVYKLLTISGDSTTVTESTESAAGVNVFYYLDGTTVKSAKTNVAVTGQQINSLTIANGLAPIIYQYDSVNYVTNEFHYFQWHSGGLVFRTLDGKKQIYIPWGSSTATITQSPGYSANIVFYLDGTTVKYTGTNTAVTGSDVAAMTLANGNMPVIRQMDSSYVDHYYHLDKSHSGGMEFRMLDGTKKLTLAYNSSTAVITNL